MIDSISETQTRRWWFFGLIMFFGIGLVANELTGGIFDYALASYISCVSVLMCAASMLTYCWIKRGASAPYALMTLMAWSMAFAIACQAVMRWTWLFNRAAYERMMASNWWAYRKTSLLILACYLLAWIIGRYRAFSDMKKAIAAGYIPTKDEREQQANGLAKLKARVISGELRFAGHTHEGLLVDAKLILQTEKD